LSNKYRTLTNKKAPASEPEPWAKVNGLRWSEHLNTDIAKYPADFKKSLLHFGFNLRFFIAILF